MKYALVMKEDGFYCVTLPAASTAPSGWLVFETAKARAGYIKAQGITVWNGAHATQPISKETTDELLL